MPETWVAASLRLTAFTDSLDVPDRVSWWTDITGELPEKSGFKPKAQRYDEEGILGSAKFSLTIQPGRIDWVRSPEEEIGGDQSFSHIGQISRALDEFLPLMEKWLRMAPEIRRLAFGAVLLRPVATKADGYSALSEYLHGIKLDPETMSDFEYQINRRRPASEELGRLPLNRLSKWSVAVLRTGLVRVGDAPVSTPPKEHYACRLQLDVNTVPEHRLSLPKEKLGRLFTELVALGLEIASKGDIP